ncbi:MULTISPECIES: TetR/AcrR family transcriptional regulator [unclassified Gilliamella]|uniref:TetR/AcrR family transcriptional regulator n=1 Tax=unclassified Gilliamella TaxID=2685620 RepID=UPI002269903E|nr:MULTISPECIES: TetR/AcrR family transcriptional regulator [unclassified Gilliamella]MCX8573682.1 TetR/AcrR family transcriptional regulator [Gilliamella sp. B3831]MCX8575690.1 TetR/AcrR family transcriptional regulator [Gilliamella sp. B3815]MCX8578163.1 TetR/AcrR family transcriptional regulator [Gilliamella sp. B2717]MCX8586986.1 TetR/AcrR family transcriptional regulator [Gilliamella sp. B3801]MCX8589891.1 TetR/AcrR family transcriptional regulator [Gilliamella sp. B3812]
MNNKQNSKDKLIKAMADLLLEKGLAATSPRDILTRAEVGQGSLYHYFNGKEDLSLYAIKYNVDQLISFNASVLNTDKNAYNKLSDLLLRARNIDRGCVVGQMARDRAIMENKKLASEVNRGFESMKKTLESLIKIGIAEGSISNILAPLEAATLLMSALQGAYISAKGLQDDSYFHLTINTLLKIFTP